MNKKRVIFLSIVLGIVIILAVGIVIPKLTVRVAVSVDESFRNSVMQAANIY